MQTVDFIQERLVTIQEPQKSAELTFNQKKIVKCVSGKFHSTLFSPTAMENKSYKQISHVHFDYDFKTGMISSSVTSVLTHEAPELDLDHFRLSKYDFLIVGRYVDQRREFYLHRYHPNANPTLKQVVESALSDLRNFTS